MAAELPEPEVRLLGDGESPPADFRCSSGAWFEDDVQTWVTERLRPHIDAHPEDDCRCLLFEHPETRELLGIGLHQNDYDVVIEGRILTSTLLKVGAVSRPVQGAVLPDVEPFEDGKPVTVGRYLMETMLEDALERDREPVVRGIVARENERSQRLCRSVGLTIERNSQDERYLQLLGTFPTG